MDIIKNTTANLREVLWADSANKALRAAQDSFEVLIDGLIFFILKNANLKSQ